MPKRIPRKQKHEIKRAYVAILFAVVRERRPNLTNAQCRRGFRQSFKRKRFALNYTGPTGSITLKVRGDEV